MQLNVQYVTASEIMRVLGVGRTKAYEIVKELNHSLDEEGFNTLRGKVPTRYFQRKYYGCELGGD